MNLAEYVIVGKDGEPKFDYASFKLDVAVLVRFLDNVLEVNKFALEDNRIMSHRLRRLGLGIMGLADMLIEMGYRYGSEEGRSLVTDIITEMRVAATQASKDLGKERGIPEDLKNIGLDRRNIALLTVAPTGTTSMLMGVSSGVEPIYSPFIYRKIGSEYVTLIAPLFKDLLSKYEPHPDYSEFLTASMVAKKEDGGLVWDWRKVIAALEGEEGSVQNLEFVPQKLRDVFVCAHDISPRDHVLMQATVQRAFDEGGEKVANSLSKTINMPNSATEDDVYDSYALAHKEGCKGITIYRDGSRQFQVLSTSSKKKDAKAKAEPEKLEIKPEEPVSAPLTPKLDRPFRLEGFTDSIKLTLPNGEKRSFYVTVNDQDGIPSEVFVLSGKAGDESNADSEALGRLVSIALQYGVPVEVIVKTLQGINGGMYGFYQNSVVSSKAGLIAVALESTLDSKTRNSIKPKNPCPECGAPLFFEEGCNKCENCGYSRCG